jgi:hypothetical protein
VASPAVPEPPTAQSAIALGLRYGPNAGMALQRSQYLADALRQLQAGGSDIRTPQALGTSLLAEAITAYGKNKADKQAMQAYGQDRQSQIANTLAGLPGIGDAGPSPAAPVPTPQPSPQAPVIDPAIAAQALAGTSPSAPQAQPALNMTSALLRGQTPPAPAAAAAPQAIGVPAPIPQPAQAPLPALAPGAPMAPGGAAPPSAPPAGAAPALVSPQEVEIAKSMMMSNDPAIQQQGIAKAYALRQRMADPAIQAAMHQYANDPQALVLLRNDPKAFFDAEAKNREAVTIGGGDSRFTPGQGFQTAPKLVENGGIYGTQTPTGFSQTGARGPSIAETETARNDQFNNKIASGNLGVAQANAGTERGRLAEDVRFHNIQNPFGTGNGPAGGGAGAPSGPDVLKALAPNIATQVQGIAEGRIPLPSGAALRSPYWQQMIGAVSQYDPTFDVANSHTRVATRKDFTSGKAAQNITSLNTAIGHMGELAQNIDALHNGSFTPLNSIANAVKDATGQPSVNNFNIVRNAVGDELTRVFRGTGGTGAEVESWKNTMSAAKSPQQLHQALTQGVDLLNSRLEALGAQYDQGMGTSGSGIKLLTPKAQATLAALGAGGQQAAPSEHLTPEQAAQLPSGTHFTGTDGVQRVKH